MRVRPAAVPGAALAAGSVVVVGLAALLAAHQPAPRVERTGVVVATDDSVTSGVTGGANGGFPWWVLPVVVVLVLLALALLWFVLRDLLLGTAGVGRQVDRSAAEGEHLRREADLAAAARRALTRASDDLDRGADAREVVVACWVAVEDAAQAAGLGRRPAETATDVARRWLAAGPDRAAVDDLAALYHLARYSTHPLTDAHRERARAALRSALGTPDTQRTPA